MPDNRRDDYVLEDVARRLVEAGVVGDRSSVVVGASPKQKDIPIGPPAVAWIARTGGRNRSLSADPPEDDRTIEFTVWLETRPDANSIDGAAWIEWAEAVATDAIADQPLGGFCRPAFSRVDRSQVDESARDSTRRVRLQCVAVYGVMRGQRPKGWPQP